MAPRTFFRLPVSCLYGLAAALCLCACDSGALGPEASGTNGFFEENGLPARLLEKVKLHKPSPTPPIPFGHKASDYRLTFAEEFEHGFNRERWNDTSWDKPANPTVNYAVEDGMLKIWPERDANGQFFPRIVDTDGKFHQTYGYFEIEAKLPRGKGTWPAFWLYNHDDEKGTFRPEIDIMEAYAGGGPESGWSNARLHPTAYAITVWTGEPEVKGGERMLQDIGDLSARFHKYALKWEPHKQTFYFDGREVYSAQVSMPHRMYLMLDLMYGSASGEADHTTPTGKTNAFEIKYVRVWQFKTKHPAR